jgi:hypothetical protein
VPGAIFVGETVAAIHAGHWVSMDGDHVLEDVDLAADVPDHYSSTTA